MSTIVAIGFLAGLLLVYVFCLSGLAAYSKVRAGRLAAEEIRSREGVYLIGLNFLLILALLLWRAG
jgi:hypothetical protein